MTDSQIQVADQHIDYHTKLWRFEKPNVSFIKGFIESLDSIEDESIDLIVSNCVVNLSPDKESVLKECYRVLKPGGEFYFSDVYSDRRIPEICRKDKTLWGECLSGALYTNDFITLSKKVGFKDPRRVTSTVVTLSNDLDLNEEVKKSIEQTTFYSITYRLFKLDQLEPYCEDYGQKVFYKGTIQGCPDSFTLDESHIIPKGEQFDVCSNTFAMLQDTRYREHFEFIGDLSVHYGIFKDCGKKSESSNSCKPSKGCC